MRKSLDWKDCVSKKQDQTLLLAILSILLMFLALPKFKAKPYEIEIKQVFKSIDIESIENKKITLPKKIDTNVSLVIDDEISLDDDVIEITPIEMQEIIDQHLYQAPVQEKFIYYEKYPVLMKAEQPSYTKFAKEAGIEGTVNLEILVGENGKVKSVILIKSLESGLDKNAIEAAQKFIFQPAESNGKPIECLIRQAIRFSLN